MEQARKKDKAANSRTITVEAAAKELGISRSSAYEAAHRGEIPAIVIGRRVLVLRRGLDDILEGTRAVPSSQVPERSERT